MTETQHKLAELLVACPHCGRTGFTIRGLRLHWCKMKTRGGQVLPGAHKLGFAEWQATVARAQAAWAMERAGAR